MYLHPIRMGYRLQGVPFVSRLTAAFLSAGSAQTLCLFLQPIARWRFAAVAAVLGYLVFQSLDTLGQFAKRFVKQPDYSIFALVIRSADFFIGRLADWLHAYIVLGFCDFDNVKVHSGLCLSSYKKIK
jgi:hypothetical protein